MTAGLFTPEDRDRARDLVLRLAAEDPRIVAGAVIGSLALEGGDRWSDLDLTFAVSDGEPIPAVLADWTRRLAETLGAVHLFDLPSGSSTYRVFLLPGSLQFDLSFAPAADFGARGPKFRLLFGTAVERPFPSPPAAAELFGLAAHHVLRARFCLERGKVWQAEYWIHEARDLALSLACLRRGLPASHGRGLDALPNEARAAFQPTLARSLEGTELLRALGVVIERLLAEAGEARATADRIEPDLRRLAVPWPAGPSHDRGGPSA